ncbi:(2Fe-2S)-binding protein [Streptomyces fulvoviolaceus]|uniref:(2Fe-2S)-binding protein n=1 Tax=Streptomyces fulvoviolaceus TaxID=285535 RepID=UPI0004C8A9AC|nr:(2Fe-2S)-binding protein [Streptomyces fulvoviolaceus]MCT9079568.1 (2Fe-2S)-binding protein [Streptomyces fulvoviolaceus]
MPIPLPAPRSAVTAAYARMTKAFPGLTVTELDTGEQPPRTGGWVTAAALAEDDEALDTFLAWDDEQVQRDNNQKARPDVIASFGLHRYAWPACLLFTAPWFLHRRVPRYPVTHVSYDRTEGPMAFAVRPGPFACLPDDPAAALPGARTVPDEEALRAELRDAIAEHMEPVLTAFGPRMRRRGRALWGMVTDEIVEGLWFVAEQLGEHEKRRAERELDRLLPGTTKPYVGTPAFRVLTGPNNEPLPTRDRASCCMYYTLDPDDTCATCPRTCDADRITKLTAAAAS